MTWSTKYKQARQVHVGSTNAAAVLLNFFARKATREAILDFMGLSH
jgi:hypothetical protein